MLGREEHKESRVTVDVVNGSIRVFPSQFSGTIWTKSEDYEATILLDAG